MRFLSLAISFFLILVAPAFAASDVPGTHPFAKDVEFFEEKGIIREDPFRPNEIITREVFAAWLLKNAGFNETTYRPKLRRPFLDVPWNPKSSAPFIAKLAELGALDSAKAKHFYPQKPLTRQTALEWIFSVEGIAVPKIFDEKSFEATDVPLRSAAAPLADKAIRLGLLPPGRVQLGKKLTRAGALHLIRAGHEATAIVTVTLLPSANADILKNPKFDLLADIWQKIIKTYLHRDEIDKEKMVFGAIDGLVKELGDRHSEFERPGDNALLESLSGEIEGIGAVLQMKDDEVVIVTPIASSPAEKAGLKPGDTVASVDGKPVKGLKLSEVVARIKGKRGTKVKLEIRRNGKILFFEITREVVKIESIKLTLRDDGIAHVQVHEFGAHTKEEFAAAVKQILEKKPKGIILDLRNNPGGFLDKAIELAGAFIPKGEKVAVVRYPNRKQIYESDGKAELATYPLAILVNGGSASAAEILAGALQDYKIGMIIGEKTYGKGTVQELTDFSDGSTLKLTVAEWLTPKERSIEKDGVTPDIIVKPSEDDAKTGRDPQLERAVLELN